MRLRRRVSKLFSVVSVAARSIILKADAEARRKSRDTLRSTDVSRPEATENQFFLNAADVMKQALHNAFITCVHNFITCVMKTFCIMKLVMKLTI